MTRMCCLLLALGAIACDAGPTVVRADGSEARAAGAKGGWGEPDVAAEDAAPGERAGPDNAPAPGVSKSGRVRHCVDDPDIGFLSPWYAFSDRDQLDEVEGCEAGDSEVQLYVPSSPPPSGWCPTGMRGRLDAEHDGAYAGMGVRFDKGDRRGFEGFVLATRGDGRGYRADFVDLYQESRLGGCGDEDGNHPGFHFRCGDGGGGWTQVPVRFADLKQRPDWGEPHALQLRDLRKLSIIYDGWGGRDPSAEGAERADEFNCEVAVIRWVARAEAAP